MSRPPRTGERYVWRSAHGRSYVPAVIDPWRWCEACRTTWNPLEDNERPDRCPRCSQPGCPERDG